MNTIRLRRTTPRANAPAVITEVTVEVIRREPEFDLLIGRELSRFCYVDGYRDQGRDIGARNEYDHTGAWRPSAFVPAPGVRQAYILDLLNWIEA